MTPLEIRDQFDEAAARGDLKHMLKLIQQAEDLGYDTEKMRDICGRQETDEHSD